MQTKTIRVKGGDITISISPKFVKDMKTFSQLYQEESRKCYMKSQEAEGQKVDCRESSVKLMQEFDRVFGEGACNKVFGNGYVSFQAFSEYFEKLELLMHEWAKE